MNKDIRIRYKMRAPVSHIGETASTGTIFQTVLTKDGRLPVITGNSMRGTLRDCSALDLLETVDCKVDKEVFNILFSGGNLNGTMKNDVGKAKNVRSLFPSISLLGGGLGDMIMQGKLIAGNLYPVCIETEEMLGEEAHGISWRSLIDEIEMTRMDNTKDDKLEKYIENADSESKSKASTQMRFSVQYMAIGTVFVQDVKLVDCTELEMGAFYAAIKKWFEKPVLGGMSAKGFGLFDGDAGLVYEVSDTVVVEPEAQELIDKFHNFVKENITEETFNTLVTKGGK